MSNLHKHENHQSWTLHSFLSHLGVNGSIHGLLNTASSQFMHLCFSSWSTWPDQHRIELELGYGCVDTAKLIDDKLTSDEG
jgi:hypothetical protein